MIQSKMIEKEDELVCSMNHKLPISMVVFDKSLENKKKLLCNECIDNLESKLNNSISFKKVALLIEENQKKKLELVEYFIMTNRQQIEEIQKKLHELKSCLIQQLDQLIGNTEEWIKCLYQIGQQNATYSFYEELDRLINQTKISELYYQPLVNQITLINHSWNEKIIKKLNQFKQFELVQKCEQLLINLNNINQEQNLMMQTNLFQGYQHIDNLIINYSNVQFKLIDDFNEQISLSYQIVFNKFGTIMISIDSFDIKVWDFNQGRLKLQNRIQVHQSSVKCLVYSKKVNCFISGSDDKSIICWKQINNNEWMRSQLYKYHTDWVLCLILNKQEDQLISGGRDNSIKVWNVDFIQNELRYLYSLDNTWPVFSLSFNQSETFLASCAEKHFLIWKKGVKDKWKLKCKQQISKGYQIQFINDQQFLWVTKDQNIDQIMIFELQGQVFKEKQDKVIQLNSNHLCEDYWINFPVVYNQDKNLLLVRHKHHIYLFNKLNEDNFKIIGSLNCDHRNIYGTMTDNAQYLVFWDGKQQKYHSYELIYR
ncbi:unnamed protein product [Paramecium pentaurelia]|uniref:Uncharacterized protein n=1 Tax=Paramecium pentaurelia TaxID=43138 RepID=A0A8S1W9Z0_9CILI|nr:unnamed protein product [Paramecium pentaurelia]